MPVYYTVVKQQGPPGSEYENRDLYYARASSVREIDTDRLAEQIQMMSTVSPGDVKAVLYGLRDVIPRGLANGNIVRLEGIGAFRIGVSSKAAESPDEVLPRNFHPPRIHYTPGPRFKTMLKEITYKRKDR